MASVMRHQFRNCEKRLLEGFGSEKGKMIRQGANRRLYGLL